MGPNCEKILKIKRQFLSLQRRPHPTPRQRGTLDSAGKMAERG
jgi:hypothetical protein